MADLELSAGATKIGVRQAELAGMMSSGTKGRSDERSSGQIGGDHTGNDKSMGCPRSIGARREAVLAQVWAYNVKNNKEGAGLSAEWCCSVPSRPGTYCSTGSWARRG